MNVEAYRLPVADGTGAYRQSIADCYYCRDFLCFRQA
jgi:hypothetical protein